MKTYPIKEIFYSLQGEGFHTGIPALFIRFAGCNLACPFCDTDFTGGEQLSLEQIKERVGFEAGFRETHLTGAGRGERGSIASGSERGYGPNLVVLTGGEPTLFADKSLCDWLRSRFKTVAMETNGTRPVPKGVNWVTLSPKSDFLGEGAAPVLESCDELKVLYNGENDPLKWTERVRAAHYFIQPCDVQDPERNRQIMASAIEIIKSNPAWRLSLQTHKFLNIR